MDKHQAHSDDRDNKRAFRWGAIAVVVLLILAVGAYTVLSTRRQAEPTMQPLPTPERSEPVKPPGQ
ncbi:MAG: hypothetical protein EOO22_08485 [Comamonadaceae bacterium]|nr:MAG: hypothetical protein EOO22_08485 [Comamonadaceae bacterium]